jgi:hypothetical protein
MMIGLHVRTGMLMNMNTGRVIVAHRFVVVIMLCCSGRRYTEGHRRGSETLNR